MTTLHVRDAPPGDLLRIYLEDHLTGITVARELAQRSLSANRGTPYEPGLRRVAGEIDQELAALRAILHQLGRRWSITPVAKVVAALAGERLGRLKLNGQLQGYSPLSRLVELEALAATVGAKRSLWRSLQVLRDSEALPDDIDLEHLVRQADDQLTRLQAPHDRAAETAFAAA